MGPRRREPEATPAPGVTLWRRIADDLEQDIALGTHAAGDRLPGEVEIAARFGVNRHTVRRALAELTERGLVRAARGSGTYVEGKRLAYPIGARTRFSEIVGSAGRGPDGRLIAHASEPATADIAKRLGLKVGELVVRLEIVRSADRVPIACGTNWLPAARAADAARVFRTTRSITATLAHFGIKDYRRQSTRITAAAADAVDAERLHLAPGRAVLIVDSVNVTLAGTPILISRARFAADRVELVVES
ncbi:MAG TPA: phosphonate metabolism transcriptional regulator PhnF [Xanthobacteraceae bacterium]|jgi:GntR family phosphonate transport system transcriptional regulator